MSEQPETPPAAEKAVRRTTDPADKPMGATQRRDLGKLIDGDFESLKGELKVFANQLTLRRTREVEEQFEQQETEARQIEAEWLEFAQGLRRQADEWMSTRRAQGFIISGTSNRYGGGDAAPITINPVRVALPAKERAMAEIKNVVAHQQMAAMQALERQRLQLQRELLLTGLSSNAAKSIIDKMPDPRQVLMGVMEEAQRAGITGPAVQQIEGGVQVHHGHDEAAVVIGEVLT